MLDADLLTTAEVALRLGCSVGHVRHLAAAGRLAADRRYPGVLLFPPAEVERYAAERRPPGRPPRVPPSAGSPALTEAGR